MANQRTALLIASYDYEDPDLTQLMAPEHDAEALGRVLADGSIGGFKVETLLNEGSYEVRQSLEEFFSDRKRDDLLLLYFSGHGIKDESGKLYFATRDTRRKRLRSTAISASFINELMGQSRSRKQILILDSCYSGAFARGMVVRADAEVGTGEFFKQGRGQVVLTASDAMQYAFEGDDVKGQGVQSVFTKTMIKGLESGEADLDQDGDVSFDEFYNYVHDKVTERMPEQEPRKWAFDVQGDLVIARNPTPSGKPLSPDLLAAIHNPLSGVREGAIRELENLITLHDKGLALTALNSLEELLDDDSRRVSRLAAELLAKYRKEPKEKSIKPAVVEKVSIPEKQKVENHEPVAKEKPHIEHTPIHRQPSTKITEKKKQQHQPQQQQFTSPEKDSTIVQASKPARWSAIKGSVIKLAVIWLVTWFCMKWILLNSVGFSMELFPIYR